MKGNPSQPRGTATIVIAAAVITAAAVMGAQMKVTTTPAQSADSRLVQLEQRVRDLEARVKALEDEGDFPQDDAAKGGAQPAGRDASGGTAGRGGEAGPATGGGNARATRVKAPFEVVDGDGKVLLRVERGAAGGGVVKAMNPSGALAALFGTGPSGRAGAVRLMLDDKEAVSIGSTTDGGSIYLKDLSGMERVQLFSTQGVALWDNSGHERVRLGFAEGNRGYVAVRNDKGAEVAHLFESPNGVGSLVTRDGEGQGVQIGTKTRASGAFGDVCATSPKGGMCLSVLAIKAMSPY